MEWCTDDKNTFVEKYQQYLNNGDFIGASNYLKSFNYPKEKAPEINAVCKELERKAYEHNMLMSNPNIDQNLIRFREDYLNNGDLSNKPGVYKDFCDYMKVLADSDGKIRIDMEGSTHKRYGLFGIDAFSSDIKGLENGLDLFKSQLGLSSDPLLANQQLKKMGISIQYNKNNNPSLLDNYLPDYPTYLEIDTSNPQQAYRALKAVVNTNTNHSIVSGSQPLNPDGDNTDYRWKFKDLGQGSYYSTAPSAGLASSASITRYSDETVGTLGNKLSAIADRTNPLYRIKNGREVDNPFNKPEEPIYSSTSEAKLSALEGMLSIVDRAEEEYKKGLGVAEERKLTMPVQKIGIKSAPIQNLLDMRSRGEINNDVYDDYLKYYEESMLDHIRNAHYENYTVYANSADPREEGASRGVLHELKDDEKYNLRDIISNNIKDGKQVIYEMGRRGDQIGLVIGFADKIDDEKGEIQKSNVPTAYKELFVVDFTKGASSYDDALYNDNKTEAALDMGRLFIYHTPLDVSKEVEGTKEWIEPIYDENNTDYNTVKHYTKNGNNPATFEYISVEEAQKLRNRKIIIDRCIDNAIRSNYDPYGRYSPNNNLDYQINRVIDAALVELFPEWVQQLSVQKTLGLDSSREENFLNEERNNLFNYIKNSVNLLIQV